MMRRRMHPIWRALDMALDGLDAADRAENQMAEAVVKMGRDMVDRAKARRDGFSGSDCIDTEGETL